MGIERGCTVGAHDLKVLKTVIVTYSVDVVENQRHPTTPPKLVLPAKLAYPVL
jgi:hypothetical protein